MRKITLFALLVVSVVSCKTSQNANYNDYSTLNLNKPAVLTKPIIAELEIGSKTTITQTFTNSLLEQAREASLAQFCKDNNCDVVVHPMFSIETETENNKGGTLRNKVTVKLTGFPGAYKNLRNYEPKDTSYFNAKFLSVASASTYVAASQPETTKPKTNQIKRMIIGLSITAGVALITLLLL